MLELVITNHLGRNVLIEKRKQYLLSMRRLTVGEVSFARKMNIKRYCLPSLSNEESSEFFIELDRFWNELIKPYSFRHPFWRNALSSKMQEWEKSAMYFALILFTLSKRAYETGSCLIMVCGSIEEQAVCKEWGILHGWRIYERCSLPSVIQKVLWEVKNVWSLCYTLLYTLRQKFVLRKLSCKTTDRGSEIFLIASSFYSNSLSENSYNDPFFGKLHNFFIKNGYRCAYMCLPLEPLSKEVIYKLAHQREVPIFVLHSILGWWELFSLFFRVYIRKLELPHTTFKGCQFSSLLKQHARDFRYSFNVVAEMFFLATERLYKHISIKRLYVNFEGNVFERGCIQGLMGSKNGQIVVGYSQGVVYPLNLKLRLAPKEVLMKPEPDIYVCNGSYSKQLFEIVSNGRPPAHIKVGCSLRHIPSFDHSRRMLKMDKPPCVLVALDGLSNASTLLDWLMSCAGQLSEFIFIVRSHPNVPLHSLKKQCINEWPKNFVASSHTLKDDLQKCLCVIYRQTSIGIQALLNNIPAVHLAIDLPLPGDPLMGLEINGRLIVRSEDDFVRALRSIWAMNQKEQVIVADSEQVLAKAYFAEPTDQNMSMFLH